MKTFLTLLKIEFKLSLRNFSGILFGVMIPIGLMFLFGALYDDPIKVQQTVPAVITVGICATGLMGIPITLSGYREKKLLRRFQVTPTSPLMLLMVQFFNNLITALASSIGVILVAVIGFDYRLQGSLIGFILLYFLVVFSIYTIGLLIASVSNSVNTSNLLCTLAYFPMFFLSGATVPYEIMPRPLQLVSNIMPLTHGIKILKGISTGKAITEFLIPILSLLILGLLCMLISVKTFQYDYE